MSIILIIGSGAIIAGIGETASVINHKAKVRARRNQSKHRWA